MALDKDPGVRPVGIGEAIRRLMAKLVHSLPATQAMEACGSNNLCGGLKAGIEGAIHASRTAFGRVTPPNAVSFDSHPRERLDLRRFGREQLNQTDRKESIRTPRHCSLSPKNLGR